MKIREKDFFLADILFLGGCLRLESSCIWVNMVYFSCFMHFQCMLQFLGTEDSRVLRDICTCQCLNLF